jgi:hypothetical protein
MKRVVLVCSIVSICSLPSGVSNAAENDGAASDRLYDRRNIPLVPVPAPDDPLPYDEIIWPWKMGLGHWGWGPARRNAYSTMTTWSNANPSTSADVSFYTDYGPGHRFLPQVDEARVIDVRTEDAAVLEHLKYFPEVRELRITSGHIGLDYTSLEDSLSVVRYCPHLTKLEVRSERRHRALPRIPISEESMKGIGSLQVLRFLRLVHLDVDNDDLEHLAGMKNLLYVELTNAQVTSKAFQTIATWPRIRYLKLNGLDFDQPLDEPTAKALDALVGRVELLWMNLSDTDHLHTRIHPSLEEPFRKIRANAHLARQPKPKEK